MALQATGPTILLVDDVPANVSVLFEFLISHGFRVLVAQDGESALQKVHYVHPDLILLDIMMPGIDGFETCRRLKREPASQDIPVIFMTALSDTVDKVKGFELGAVDYITKPIQQEEVLARVNAHLTIRRLQKDLQYQNEELDAFAHTVAHDLKGPLNAIIGLADVLYNFNQEKFDPDSLQSLQDLQDSAHKMADIIEALLLLARSSKQQVELKSLDMGEILGQVKRRLAHAMENRGAELSLPEAWPTALGYAPWVEEIWVNYVSNALKYGGHPPKVEVGAKPLERQIYFWVRDNGEGLDSEAQARLFAPFTRLHADRAKGHGLGLSIVRRVTEKLGGEAGVKSQPGQGSEFYFTLPRPET